MQFGEEYLIYNLPAAALAAALPLMRQRFAGWQPLDEPDRGLRDMQRWRPLLQSDSARDAIFQVHGGLRAPICTLLLQTHTKP